LAWRDVPKHSQLFDPVMVRCNKTGLSRQMPGVKRFLCGAQSTSGHQRAAKDAEHDEPTRKIFL
jgi:hypothetical protein